MPVGGVRIYTLYNSVYSALLIPPQNLLQNLSTLEHLELICGLIDSINRFMILQYLSRCYDYKM